MSLITASRHRGHQMVVDSLREERAFGGLGDLEEKSSNEGVNGIDKARGKNTVSLLGEVEWSGIDRLCQLSRNTDGYIGTLDDES